MKLAYATRARRIEMFRLNVRDLDLQRGLVCLFGKGDKERLVPIGSQAIHWLKRNLTEARPKLLNRKETPALWLSSHGGGPLGLNVADVDFKNATAIVFGKGQKERVVPIGRTALRLLESYLKGVRPFLLKNPQEPALFLNRRGERLPYQVLDDLRKTLVRCHPRERGDQAQP